MAAMPLRAFASDAGGAHQVGDRQVRFGAQQGRSGPVRGEDLVYVPDGGDGGADLGG